LLVCCWVPPWPPCVHSGCLRAHPHCLLLPWCRPLLLLSAACCQELSPLLSGWQQDPAAAADHPPHPPHGPWGGGGGWMVVVVGRGLGG